MDNRISTSRNVLESQLLLLPPEIRNRVFNYVFRGKTVHVVLVYSYDERAYRTMHHLCKMVEECTPKYRRCEQRAYDPDGILVELSTAYRDEHDEAGCQFDHSGAAPDQDRISLELLKTCRQIHKEAAVMAFLHNTFTCNSIFDLSSFLKRLFPVQQRAIREPVLCYNTPWHAAAQPFSN